MVGLKLRGRWLRWPRRERHRDETLAAARRRLFGLRAQGLHDEVIVSVLDDLIDWLERHPRGYSWRFPRVSILDASDRQAIAGLLVKGALYSAILLWVAWLAGFAGRLFLNTLGGS